MPIIIGNPENNTVAFDEPAYQEWSPLPREIQVLKSINIPGTIAPFTEYISVKDVIHLYPEGSDFRLLVNKSFIPNATVSWVAPFMYDNASGLDNAQIIPITEPGLILEFPVNLVNTGLLPLGTYRFRQNFAIQRRVTLIGWQSVSTITHDIVLNIVNDLVFFNPKNLNFTHIMNTVLPTKEVVLDGPSWKLVGNPKVTLSSINSAVTVQSFFNIDGEEFQIATGTGEAAVKVTLGEFYNAPAPEGNPLVIIPINYLKVLVGSQEVGNVSLRVRKFYTEVFELSPLELFFTSEKNINEAAPQNLIFTCNVAYEIETSLWLTATVQTIEIDGNPTQVLSVVPLSSTSMERGIYNGFIKVSALIDGQLVIKNVAVRYEISELVGIPYLENEIAFTLDNKFLNFATIKAGTYVQMKMNVLSYDFYTNSLRTNNFSEKIGLFQGKSKLNIGKTVHQILSRDKEINENVLQYIPALVTMNFDERNLSDDELVSSFSYSNLPFIAGLSANFSKIGFLKFNHLPERVTINSFKYLNIFVPSGLHKIVKYKNGTIVSQDYLLESEGKVMTIKVDFQQCQPGDKMEYKIVSDGDGVVSKLIESSIITFIVFPEGKYSNQIVWEDEFLLKQCIECTGNYNFKSNLGFISQKKYVNLVEHLSHLDINKTSKLSINTGWLMQSDVDTIESLMKSKKVWINSNGKTFFMVPVAENIISQDSERELIEYTLEFQLNPTSDEETYRL